MTPGERPPVDSAAFRAAMRRLPTGVTIVTAWAAGRPEGLTVNALASVSLEPPQVLVAIDHGSRTRGGILEAGTFGVNVLAADQAELARRFADGSLTSADRFAGVSLVRGQTLAPLIEASPAALQCRFVTAWTSGDHTIVVGEVVGTRLGAARDPLLFFEGGLQPMIVPELAAST